MDRVQHAQQYQHPVSFSTASLPPEVIEHICRFLPTQATTRLSLVDSATHGMLAQRIPAIVVTGIDTALSEGRADDAFDMFVNLTQWLGSAGATLSLDDQIRLSERLLAFAGNAGLSQEQQNAVFQHVFLSAHQRMDSAPDAVLASLECIRATWYSTVFPHGSPFVFNRPCKSFDLVSQCLQSQPDTNQSTFDAGPEPSPLKRAACLGADIEALRLHPNAAYAEKLFARVAQTLTDEYTGLSKDHATILSVDLINCLLLFSIEKAPALLPLLDPLLAASGQAKTVLERALYSVRVGFHKRATP